MKFLKGEFFKCCGSLNCFPVEKFNEIVFVGKSNVGKSSIINRLFNKKKLAKVSSKPGKTVTINFYKIESKNCFIVDLPGYGFAKVSKKTKQNWVNLINFYFSQNRLIKIIILVIDCRRGLTQFDEELINFLKFKKLSFVVVFNKIDKLNKNELNLATNKLILELKNFEILKIIKFSTKTLQGLNDLIDVILNYVE